MLFNDNGKNFNPLMIILLNGQDVGLWRHEETKLKKGDTISVFEAIGGG